MTETTMKELFDRLVDGGAPPGVRLPVAEVLSRNESVLRRHRLRRAGAVGLLAAAAAGVVVLLPNLIGPQTAPTRPAAPASAPASPPTTPPASPPTPPRVYTEAENHRRAEMMLKALVGAVPEGFTVPMKDTAPSADGTEYQLRSVFWNKETPVETAAGPLSEVTLEVQLSGRAALLTLRTTTSDSESRPPRSTPEGSGLCDTPFSAAEQNCRLVYAADGSPVRVGWWKTAAGPTRQAVRFYDGGFVLMEQTSRPRPGVYGLGRPVFDDQQLVELAADPAFAP